MNLAEIGNQLLNVLLGVVGTFNGGTAIYFLMALRGERKNKSLIGQQIDRLVLMLAPFKLILKAWAETALNSEYVSPETKVQLRTALELLNSKPEDAPDNLDELIAGGLEDGVDLLAKLFANVDPETLAKAMPENVINTIKGAVSGAVDDFYNQG